jgi:hypothetical protein
VYRNYSRMNHVRARTVGTTAVRTAVAHAVRHHSPKSAKKFGTKRSSNQPNNFGHRTNTGQGKTLSATNTGQGKTFRPSIPAKAKHRMCTGFSTDFMSEDSFPTTRFQHFGFRLKMSAAAEFLFCRIPNFPQNGCL